MPQETKKGSSRITGAPALGFQARHSFAPRTSHLAPRTSLMAHGSWLAFGLAGSASPSLLTLGRLAGETLVSTLAAQTGPPRFVPERPLRGPCIYLAYGRSTCAELASRVDTKASHDDTVEWKESRCVVPPSAPAVPGTPERCGSGRGHPVAEHLPRACAGVPADDAAARLARPTRTSGLGRVFGAHPRGEFRTSGAAVGQ
jgi:hypothetical protein